MSLRAIAVLAFMLFIIVYAQRDWFIALCGVIVFTALKEHPGLPNPFDAKGINHWSIMLLVVTLAWGISRIGRPWPWNIPRGWLIVVGSYLLLESIAIIRLCLNLDEFRPRAALLNPGYAGYDTQAVIVDCFYGPVRFVFLGFLLLDGARTRRQLLLGLLAVTAAVLAYAVTVDRHIPLRALAGGGMEFRHRVNDWTGRNPNDLAQDLAAWFWIIIAFVQLKLGRRWWRVGMLGATPIHVPDSSPASPRDWWWAPWPDPGASSVFLAVSLSAQSSLRPRSPLVCWKASTLPGCGSIACTP